MEIEIKDTKKDSFISREIIHGALFFEGKTPSRIEVAKALAKKLQAAEELISVQAIRTRFGEESATVTAYRYEQRKDLEQMEPKHLVKRQHPKKEGEKPQEASA